MCSKPVDTYPSAIQFVPEKTQKMYDKDVYTCYFVVDYVPD